ncbi:MAG: CBS domain-containing protein [Armatimonadota bacterium]|nr:CBS domain-containing protein [Armatimonadota bacterium]MDR7402221.1 CBS domain-containing protein [Armatimonadota bacterium]MDR7403349.1 CBS domain-containing protein [Armatimonadota bacterium]MDR7436977.1 CBS domain-containing protein [Armatimonadota bacterium]MDR7472249.1 CBS domain-containing protein [Armatimonadota bacterium]
MTARDIMTSPVVTVRPTTPVREAVALMLEHRISGLPVVNEVGELVGIVTEADLLPKELVPRPQPPVVDWIGPSLWVERWLSAYRKAEGRTVGEVMTHHVITATEDTPVREIAARMMRHQINRVPIVRGRRVVGIVTRADILRVFLRSDQALEDEARAILEEVLLPDEDVRVEAQEGVLTLRGRVASPGRRALLRARLEQIDGVIGIDDTELRHDFPLITASWE